MRTQIVMAREIMTMRNCETQQNAKVILPGAQFKGHKRTLYLYIFLPWGELLRDPG